MGPSERSARCDRLGRHTMLRIRVVTLIFSVISIPASVGGLLSSYWTIGATSWPIAIASAGLSLLFLSCDLFCRYLRRRRYKRQALQKSNTDTGPSPSYDAHVESDVTDAVIRHDVCRFDRKNCIVNATILLDFIIGVLFITGYGMGTASAIQTNTSNAAVLQVYESIPSLCCGLLHMLAFLMGCCAAWERACRERGGYVKLKVGFTDEASKVSVATEELTTRVERLHEMFLYQERHLHGLEAGMRTLRCPAITNATPLSNEKYEIRTVNHVLTEFGKGGLWCTYDGSDIPFSSSNSRCSQDSDLISVKTSGSDMTATE